MRHRVTKNTKANGRIDIARDFAPTLKIGECVAVGGCLLSHRSAQTILLSRSRANAQFLGSERVTPAGFGVAPKRTLFSLRCPEMNAQNKSPRSRDALASTRDACATQSSTRCESCRSARSPIALLATMTIENERPSDFIREVIADDLRTGKYNKIITRFPPEPNG